MSPQASPATNSGTSVQAPQVQASPIRKVDFRNFTYPAKPIYRQGDRTFRLIDGRYDGRPSVQGTGTPFDLPPPISLVDVIYGDVTDDGEEEAMTVLYERVAGTAIPYYVYIFGLKKDQPKVLWSFEAGDRADGGLRRVYGENGDLVVELYGKSTRVGDVEDEDQDAAACCPNFFTRTRYRWNGNKFIESGKPEVVPNPEGNAELLFEDQPVKP